MIKKRLNEIMGNEEMTIVSKCDYINTHFDPR